MASATPCKEASNDSQRASLALQKRRIKWARFEELGEGDPPSRKAYFEVSCYPITVAAEDDMELLSELFTGENLCSEFRRGVFRCACCSRPLYSSEQKWVGPCRWASFRAAVSDNSLLERPVVGYNGYTVKVSEVYCGGCRLFIGHSFADGKEKGDRHPEAHYRH